MAKERFPVTLATRHLKQLGVSFEGFLYVYEEKGGTKVSALALGVEEHIVIKTLVMEDDQKNPLVVLMHGDKEVSVKNLARSIEVKSIAPCKPEIATKHSGYLVGGTSPFGTKRVMPVYVERSIFDLDRIWINGGKRGFLVCIDPKALQRLNPILVEVAI